MGSAAIVFDGVWKKFRRGERHDSFRDLLPSLVRRLTKRTDTRELSASHDEFWAVRDVSFAVSAGEALGIIGPNGAGKSTTLKLLTRILRPTRGACAVHGRVGALIEVAAGFHPDLTGRENVFLQGAIMGMKRAEIASRLDEIVEFSGTGPFIDTQVKRYSSGMNARLGFSIAAHLDPDVLIIDEVLSVGDVAFQQKCTDRMKEFLERGVAVVFVSHNLLAVTQLCTRAVLLDKGSLAASGPAGDIVTRYGETQFGMSGAGADDRVAIRARVLHRAGAPLIDPGERLELAVDITFIREVRNGTITIAVWDLARNLIVYGATSEGMALPLLNGAPGQVAHCTFEIVANLVRGAYAVELKVFDEVQHQPYGILRPAAQFSVVENVTHYGVANLFITGRQVADVSGAAPRPLSGTAR